MDSTDERSEIGNRDAPLSANDEVSEARHDIEQTRANMGETLSAIREKLNPQQLMDQAKDTVLEVTDSMTDRAKSSLLEVADGMKDDVHTMVIDVSDHAKETAKDAATGAVSGAVEEVRNAVSAAIDSTKKASANAMETARNNPIATAVMVGAGWYLLSRRRPAATYMGRSGGVGPVLDAAMQNPIPAALLLGTALHLYHNHNGNGAQGEKSLGDQTAGVADKAGGALSDAVDTVKDTLGNAANAVKESAGRATDAAGALATSVGERVKQVESGMMHSVHANPLTVGLCAFAVGGAIALMLPDTEPENHLMGETRDSLMESAQKGAGKLLDKVHDASSKAIASVGEASQTASS